MDKLSDNEEGKYMCPECKEMTVLSSGFSGDPFCWGKCYHYFSWDKIQMLNDACAGGSESPTSNRTREEMIKDVEIKDMMKKITKKEIKDCLIRSLEDEYKGGITIESTAMVNHGPHRFWLSGDEENYLVCCFGCGQGWSDPDDCGIQDIEELVKKIYKNRKHIISLC